MHLIYFHSMKQILFFLFTLACSITAVAQDTLSSEPFDPAQYEDASNEKKYCTQKVLNQVPTKQFGLAYEWSSGFTNAHAGGSESVASMSGLRATANVLAVSTNKFLLSMGVNYWGSRVRSTSPGTQPTLNRVFSSRMDALGFSALVFKPFNDKHFLIGQLNADHAAIGLNNEFALVKKGITAYGAMMFGWKKSDYRMLALGISRSYRLGRPLILPILLYNKTFNDHWGIEALLPARGHVRYNVSTNHVLLLGYEAEGQQYAFEAEPLWLQRGEIKPRLVWEKKLAGFFWLSAQAGYRINGRFNMLNRYDGQEVHEVLRNNWGSSPYVNLGIYFVTP